MNRGTFTLNLARLIIVVLLGYFISELSEITLGRGYFYNNGGHFWLALISPAALIGLGTLLYQLCFKKTSCPPLNYFVRCFVFMVGLIFLTIVGVLIWEVTR